MTKLREGFINYLTLFGSMSTLLCCALPALLVSLGLGAVMAGLASNVPGLVWASENKLVLFGFSGLMLAVNGFFLWANRNAPCPIDSKLREACTRGRKTSLTFYVISVFAFGIGFLFAYVLPGL